MFTNYSKNGQSKNKNVKKNSFRSKGVLKMNPPSIHHSVNLLVQIKMNIIVHLKKCELFEKFSPFRKYFVEKNPYLTLYRSQIFLLDN